MLRDVGRSRNSDNARWFCCWWRSSFQPLRSDRPRKHFLLPEMPQPERSSEQPQADLKDFRIRSSVHARNVGKWNLDDPPPLVVNSNQDLLESVVTLTLELHPLDNVRPIESKPARQIGDRNAEGAGEEPIQYLAQHTSEQRGIGRSPLAITRCYNDVGRLPICPESGDELGIVGKIGIESDNILSRRRLEAI